MTDFPAPQPHLVLPQVGAILHLDTELPQTNLFEGNKHWKLDGSCALIAQDRVLALRHTLSKEGDRYAVFFPYLGLFALGDRRDEDLEIESDYSYGDYLRVVRLGRDVETVAPLPYAYESRENLHEGFVSGFGRWSWREPGWDLDGIQRTMKVKLPGTSRQDDHGDRLDIGWHATANGGLLAGNNNSGGPVLAQLAGRTMLVGLNRESIEMSGRMVQIASRIGTERREWLQNDPHGIEPRTEFSVPSSGDRQGPRVFPVGHRGPSQTETFEVPEGSSQVHVTLSATPGIRLKMALGRGDTVDLETLAPDDGPSGRFLYRDLPVDGARQITVAIAPVGTAPATAAQVQAQLCVMFT